MPALEARMPIGLPASLTGELVEAGDQIALRIHPVTPTGATVDFHVTPAPGGMSFAPGDGEFFLISLKAGGTGPNLAGADYVIHLDPWWNPAVEDQATDRAHRIGQTRPVTVDRLVAKDTIEEQILKLHGDKRNLVAGVLDGTD